MSFQPRYTGLIDKYRDYLPPVSDNTYVVSLGEGNTPLIRLNNILRDLNRDVDVYVKYEGLNPTGSFKDRGMTMAVTKALEEGSRAIICASTGNTSASAAAYAARAGITACVLIPDGKISMGKLVQALVHGAYIIKIKGNFDAGMELVKQIGSEEPITIVNSINPYRLQGQKTAAFEIMEELEGPPDYHYLPVGNAGNITANWMGYKEYWKRGIVSGYPKMIGCQASGAAPFLRGGAVENPETIATAIRIGCPQSWEGALLAQKESGGWFAEYDDETLLRAQSLLAQKEGIFCEPASAIALAGALHGIQRGEVLPGSKIVCTLTGHGLKDPDIVFKQSRDNMMVTVDAKLDSVKRAILAKVM